MILLLFRRTQRLGCEIRGSILVGFLYDTSFQPQTSVSHITSVPTYCTLYTVHVQRLQLACATPVALFNVPYVTVFIYCGLYDWNDPTSRAILNVEPKQQTETKFRVVRGHCAVPDHAPYTKGAWLARPVHLYYVSQS